MFTELVSLDQALEYRGKWWLPEQPEKQIVGLFRFSPTDGIVLELDGVLGPDVEGTEIVSYYSMILGLSSNSVSITLCSGHLAKTSTSYGSTGHRRSELYVEQAFIGVNFESAEACKFKSLEVRFAGLDEWSFRKFLDHEDREFIQSQLDWHAQRTWYSDDARRDYAGTRLSDFVDTYEATTRLKLPEPIEVAVKGYEMRFVDWPSESVSRTESKIGRESWIHFSSEQERPFDEWLGLVRHVQNFLTLMMDRPTFPIVVRGRSEAAKLILGDKEKPLYSPIGILYRPPWPQPEIGSFHHGDMLFPLSTIEEELASYLTEWINNAETLRPVHNLYFSNLYNPYLYQESEFLSLTQAIETYHRRKFGGQYQSNSEYRSGLYEKFVEVIPSDLEPGFRAKLKAGTLKYANQYSLRKRLKDITASLSENLTTVDFLRTKEDRNAFTEKVRSVRNHLTHYDPEEEVEVTPTELFHLTRRLELLAKVCLLQEAGLGLDLIQKTMSGRVRYRELFQSG